MAKAVPKTRNRLEIIFSRQSGRQFKCREKPATKILIFFVFTNSLKTNRGVGFASAPI